MASSNPAPITCEEEHAFCGVCYEPYDDNTHKAKFLQCYHTFCSECLTTLATISRDNRIECPTCRTQTWFPEQGVGGLQTNFYLKNSEIKNSAHTEELSEKYENVTQIYICDEHCKQTSFFCKTCNKAICSDCLKMDHKSEDGHKIGSIGKAVSEKRHTLQDQLNQSHITMTRLQSAIQQIDGELQKLDASKASSINDLHSFIQSLQQRLDQCKERATNDILQHHKTEQNELLGKKRQFEESINMLLSDVTHSQEITKTGGIHELNFHVQKLKEVNENTKSDFKLFHQIRSCFASDLISGSTLNNNLCDSGDMCLQSNFPTSIHWTCNEATAGLKAAITVELLNDTGNKVPFVASFLTVKIFDPCDKELPVALSTTSPDCTLTFIPQRSGMHKISILYLRKILTCTNNCISVNSNNPILKFGKKGNGNGSFNTPRSIRIDKNNCLYVTDPGNRLIQKFTADGEFLHQFAVNINGDKYCAFDMAVDEVKGNIICPEVYSGVVRYSSGNKVLVFDVEGELQHEDTNNIMYIGRHIAMNNRGDMIISDFKANSISIQDKQGKLISEIKKPEISLNGPTFMCIQEDNSIILSDTGNRCIKILNSEGNFLYQIGSYGKKAGQMLHPSGVATDGENILVVDGGLFNGCIQVFKLDGTFVSIIESKDDSLKEPRGLAVTKDGHIYVVDQKNHCIKKYKYMDMPK